MRLRWYWLLAGIGLALFGSGLALLLVYGNAIPNNLTPQEQIDMRMQGATPQQMSDAISEKRLHSEEFRNTMIGVGLIGGAIVISCGMMVSANTIGCSDDGDVAPEPAPAAPAQLNP